MGNPYTVWLSAGQHLLAFVEAPQPDEMLRVLHVYLDDTEVGRIELHGHVFPGYCVMSDGIMLWASCGCYHLRYGDRALRKLEEKAGKGEIWGEILWVCELPQLPQHACIVHEIGVSLRSLQTLASVSSWSHDEIILRCSWRGNAITLSDLQERRYVLTWRASPPSISVNPWTPDDA